MERHNRANHSARYTEFWATSRARTTKRCGFTEPHLKSAEMYCCALNLQITSSVQYLCLQTLGVFFLSCGHTDLYYILWIWRKWQATDHEHSYHASGAWITQVLTFSSVVNIPELRGNVEIHFENALGYAWSQPEGCWINECSWFQTSWNICFTSLKCREALYNWVQGIYFCYMLPKWGEAFSKVPFAIRRLGERSE